MGYTYTGRRSLWELTPQEIYRLTVGYKSLHGTSAEAGADNNPLKQESAKGRVRPGDMERFKEFDEKGFNQN